MAKPILAASLLSIVLATSAYSQQTPANGQQQSQPAPVVHRMIPNGWFGGKNLQKIPVRQQPTSNVQRAIAQSVEGKRAKLAGHFDTAGSFSRYSSRRSGAAARLKALKNAEVFPNIPTTKPQKVTTKVAEPAKVVAPPVQQTTPQMTAPPVATTTPPADRTPPANEPIGTPAPVAESSVDLDSLPSIMTEAPKQVEKIASKPEPVPTQTQPITEEPEIIEGFADATEEPLTIETPVEITTPIDDQIPQPVAPEDSWQVQGSEATIQSTETEIEVVTNEPEEIEPEAELEPAKTQHSPVLYAEAKGPQTIIVGRPATYVVELFSQNSHTAKDVSVLVNIPSWVEVEDNHSSIGTSRLIPDENGHSLVQWRIDRLRGDSTEQLKLKLVPRESRTIDLAVNWMFKPSTSIKHIQVQEPKLELSVTGPHEVLFGDTQLYTITVSNPGTGDAENVVLHLLPIVPTESTVGMKKIGVLKAGDRQTIKVELTARQAGDLQVRARATADGSLQATDEQLVVVRRPNLVVEVDGPPTKYAGTVAEYTVRVSNNGDATAREVAAIAKLPVGATYLSSSDGGQHDAEQSQVRWQVGALRPNDSRIFQVQCQLDTPGSNRIDVRSTATGDLSALQSYTTAVESLADLKLTVNDPAGAIAVGKNTTYELKIVNRGTKAARNIQVVGYFSEGIEPVSIGNWRGDVEEGQVSLEEIPRIGPGQEMTIRVVAQASRPGDHVFRAELECRDPHTRLAHEEWTSFYGDPQPVRQASREPAYGPDASVPQRLDIRR